MAIASTIRRRCGRSSATGARRSTKRRRSGLRFASSFTTNLLAGATIPVVYFPEDGEAVQDSPRLALVVVDPVEEWNGGGQVRERIGQ